jgi:coniferyl-aldehyde dehydrogenase
MLSVLRRQKQAYLDEGEVTAATRIDRITRAITLLVDHEDAFVDALARDFGHRSRDVSRVVDIMTPLVSLKHAKKHVHRWMKPERRKLDFPLGLLGAKAHVRYQPKGVVGVISPWNLPVALTFGPLAGVFGAGNRVMIKPSEFTPATAALMARLFAAAYDETEVAVFTGGPDVGEAFSRLPFDHLLFTGSTAVGRRVMQAAAENLVPVTLEMGGKSPVIVGHGADVKQVAESLIITKLVNAGQLCLAPDFIFVPEDRKQELVGALEAATVEMYPTMRDNPDYCAVISEEHRARLQSHLENAKALGAQVRTVNPSGEDFNGGAAGAKMPLSIVIEPTDDMDVMQDEIFGPVLPIKGYRDVGEAITYINAHARPLGLYYFGTDPREEERVMVETTSGGVTLNDVGFHFLQEGLPFGGVGASGIGGYHGIDGFKEFSHAKAVYRQAKVNIARLIGLKPPYGKKLEKTLDREIKK